MTSPKLHQRMDLHAAAMVWYSRNEDIVRILTQGMPHVSPSEVAVIISGCRLYATCNDELFDQLAADARKKDEVPA